MKKYLLLLGLCVFLMSLCLSTAALAADDTTAPQLLNVILNTSDFNRGDTLTVTALAVEPESGLNPQKCHVHFVCTDPNNSWMSLDDFTINLDTICSGGIQGSIVLDERMGGTYWLESISLTDQRDNSSFYSHYDGNVPDVTFNLDSDYSPPPPEPEPQGPEVTAFTLSKTSAKVGETVTFTLTATHPSGVSSASMQLNIPGGNLWYIGNYDVQLSAVTGKPGVFSGQFKITSSHPQADYYPCNIIVTSKSGIKKNYSWVAELPGGMRNRILKVSNPGYVPLVPKMTAVSISSKSIMPGNKVTMTVTTVNNCPSFAYIQLCFYNKTINKASDFQMILKPQGINNYSCTETVPMSLRDGEYVINGVYGFVELGDDYMGGGLEYPASMVANLPGGQQYIKGSEFSVTPIITVSGTDNRSLLIGTAFDALQGVTAKNALTGDITSKIEVFGGNIDTSFPGIYLIKYMVSDTVIVDGAPYPVDYTDYRWVGVTDIMPDPNASDAPLSIAKQQLRIGAASSEVSVKRNGQSVSYATSYTTPGVYTVTDNSNGSDSVSAVICSSLPDAPVISLASTSYTGIRASWSAVAGASGYEVWYGTQKYGVYSLKHTSTSKSAGSWTKTGLTTDKAYYYKVRAYSLVGGAKIYGSFSSIHSTAPGRAALALTRASSVSAKLTWVPVSGSSGYEVWRSTQKYGTYALKYTAGSSASGWKNNSLTTGKAYYYKVRSYKVVNGAKVYGQFSAIQSIVP